MKLELGFAHLRANTADMKTAVAADGTIQIPNPLLQALGLKPGAELECEVEAGRLVAQPVPPTETLARRIRERARGWRLNPAANAQAEARDRQHESDNDRREGRA